MQGNNFTRYNEFLHYNEKTTQTAPIQWAKETTLIMGDSTLHEVEENRLLGIQLNSKFSKEPLEMT